MSDGNVLGTFYQKLPMGRRYKRFGVEVKDLTKRRNMSNKQVCFQEYILKIIKL